MLYDASIDAGGENLRISIAEAGSHKPIADKRFRTTNNYGTDIGNLTDAVNELVSTQGGTINEIGMSVAGNLDKTRSMVQAAGNLTGWEGNPLQDDLTQGTGARRVVLDGDGSAAALAEAYFGNGRDHVDFLLMIIGTGVGGGWIDFHDGRPQCKKSELGHALLGWEPTPRQCGCGRNDCIECYLGGDGLAARFGCRAEDLPRGIWQSDYLPRLVKVITNLATGRDLPRIYFTGSVAVEQSWLLPLVQKQLEGHVTIVTPPELNVSAFGKDAGNMGGFALLQHYAA